MWLFCLRVEMRCTAFNDSSFKCYTTGSLWH